MKDRKLRLIITHTKWYHKILDKFRIQKYPESYYDAGDLNFKIAFDKKGRVIESSTEIEFGKEIKFLNKKI